MRTLITFAALMLFAGFAMADIPRPKVTPNKSTASTDTYLNILLSREAKEVKLVLSRNQLKQLRAELDALDGDANDTAAAGTTNLGTIVGGTFLSLAMVFAGFWLVRSGRMNKPVAAGMIMFASGGLVTMIYANAGPPPEIKFTGKLFSATVNRDKFVRGPIKLEISNVVPHPVLIVPDPEEPKKPGEE